MPRKQSYKIEFAVLNTLDSSGYTPGPGQQLTSSAAPNTSSENSKRRRRKSLWQDMFWPFVRVADGS
jgi:hypothetical protein